MKKIDIVELYKKGYSINYIVDCWYKEKIKNDIPSHKFNNMFIITDKSYTKGKARRDVEEVVLQSKKNEW